VLDDRAAGARLRGERLGAEQGALEIEQIVERQLLAAALDETADAGTARLDVERRLLMGVLSVAQRLRALEREGEPVGKAVAGLRREPGADRGVVRGRVGEHLRGQLAPQRAAGHVVARA
jgi:hypothetical protein